MNPAKNLHPDRIYLKNRARLIPDWETVFSHLFSEGTIHKDELKKIIQTVNKFFGVLTRGRTKFTLSARSSYRCWGRAWPILRY